MLTLNNTLKYALSLIALLSISTTFADSTIQPTTVATWSPAINASVQYQNAIPLVNWDVLTVTFQNDSNNELFSFTWTSLNELVTQVNWTDIVSASADVNAWTLTLTENTWSIATFLGLTVDSYFTWSSVPWQAQVNRHTDLYISSVPNNTRHLAIWICAITLDSSVTEDLDCNGGAAINTTWMLDGFDLAAKISSLSNARQWPNSVSLTQLGQVVHIERSNSDANYVSIDFDYGNSTSDWSNASQIEASPATTQQDTFTFPRDIQIDDVLYYTIDNSEHSSVCDLVFGCEDTPSFLGVFSNDIGQTSNASVVQVNINAFYIEKGDYTSFTTWTFKLRHFANVLSQTFHVDWVYEQKKFEIISLIDSPLWTTYSFTINWVEQNWFVIDLTQWHMTAVDNIEITGWFNTPELVFTSTIPWNHIELSDLVITSPPANCSVSIQDVNWHSYSVGAINHGAILAVTTANTYSISNWIATYTQTFSCVAGTVYTIWGEVNDTPVCSDWYSVSGNSCVAIIPEVVAPVVQQSSWGWSWGWSWLSVDSCPNWDYSSSYYDWTCWTKPIASKNDETSKTTTNENKAEIIKTNPVVETMIAIAKKNVDKMLVDKWIEYKAKLVLQLKKLINENHSTNNLTKEQVKTILTSLVEYLK